MSACSADTQPPSRHIGCGRARIMRTSFLGSRGLLLLAAAFLGAPVSGATTVTLAPSKDNTLYESDQGELSNGIGVYVFAGNTRQATGAARRGLLAFNLAAIPAQSLVTSATLT